MEAPSPRLTKVLALNPGCVLTAQGPGPIHLPCSVLLAEVFLASKVTEALLALSQVLKCHGFSSW